ncbi:hypothetical protein SASPL_144603 [Salvia splendens]|uniref:Uncharacterized protein n=1 Tax=Salvia splendens TaxID=180675 RepID=A0A8X8WFK6_SALSN|nr:hypothetical protein SASPL_144603 [Salvia splendens]
MRHPRLGATVLRPLTGVPESSLGFLLSMLEADFVQVGISYFELGVGSLFQVFFGYSMLILGLHCTTSRGCPLTDFVSCIGHSEALVARGERLELEKYFHRLYSKDLNGDCFLVAALATYWDLVKILIRDSQLFLGYLFATVRVEEKDAGADLP